MLLVVLAIAAIFGVSTLPSPPKPELLKSHTAIPILALKEKVVTSTSHSVRFSQALSNYFLVTRAIDGDTIELETGKHVRYIGINTPESVHPRKAVQCFGHEAAERNRQLVEGEYVRLVKDVSETDRYGRLLRYVYLKNGTFINLELVKEGYAHAATWPPDVNYSLQFVAAERIAREEGRGLWGACK